MTKTKPHTFARTFTPPTHLPTAPLSRPSAIKIPGDRPVLSTRASESAEAERIRRASLAREVMWWVLRRARCRVSAGAAGAGAGAGMEWKMGEEGKRERRVGRRGGCEGARGSFWDWASRVGMICSADVVDDFSLAFDGQTGRFWLD